MTVVPSKEVIESKYLLEFSEFKEIDAVNIHFTDEGEGPVILLLHANYANLIDWEPWVKQLKRNFRVIRIDIPGHGLTEADSTNDYSMKRTVFLIQELLEELEIEKLSIAASTREPPEPPSPL